MTNTTPDTGGQIATTVAARDIDQARVAAENLKANYADILADDEELARDFVEGETNLYSLIERGVAKLGEDGAVVAGIKSHIEDLQTRSERISSRMDTIRAALCAAMETALLNSHECPAGTISLKRVPPKLVVTDEAEIPSDYFIPREPKLDRAALAAALKNKQVVPGATMSNGGTTIQVRVK